MKKGLFVILFCFGLLSVGMSQNRSVVFESGDYQSALSKAIKEKKILFIDFYTVWCGPCKTMSKEVFTNDQVADYFNKRFVNFKVDAEKGEGISLAKKFKVTAYPTYVLLNGNEEEVFRAMGASSAEQFLQKIEKGLDPQRRPEALKKRFEGGERTPQLIYDYAQQVFMDGKEEAGMKIMNDYYNSLSDQKRVQPENFYLYQRFTLSDSLENPKILYLIKNKERFCKANGKKVVEDLLDGWIRGEVLRYAGNYHYDKNELNKAAYEKVKARIREAALPQQESMNSLLKVADARVYKSLEEFMDVCLLEFPKLKSNERFVMMINFCGISSLRNPVLNGKAVRLLKRYSAGLDQITARMIARSVAEMEKTLSFTLVAHIKGADKGRLMFSSYTRDVKKDTVVFENGKAVMTILEKDTLKGSMRIESDDIAYLNSRGLKIYSYMDIMTVPGETAEIEILVEKAKPVMVKWIKGDEVSKDFIELNYGILRPINEEYSQLTIDNNIKGGDVRVYDSVLQDMMKKEKAAIVDFARTHTDSYVSAYYMFDKYTTFDENEAEQIFNKFPVAVQASKVGKALRRKLDVGKPYRAGAVAPDFVKKDMNGKEVSLSQFKGKYVVLDFWGSWCGPCRESHPHLRQLHEKYAPEGVVFVNVAQENGRDLEKMKESWLTAVKEDKLTWTQVLNNEGIDDCNLVKLYNVSSFPTKILIGPDGKIAERAVGGNADLEPALKKAFK